MDTPEVRNRRQRIDDANAALSRAHSNQADAEAKAMRMSSDTARAEMRVIEATKEVDAARVQLAEALAYEDIAVANPPVVEDPNLAFLDELDRDLNGKSREYALTRVTEADQHRLSVIIRSGSPLTNRAGALLNFLAGHVASGAESDAIIGNAAQTALV